MRINSLNHINQVFKKAQSYEFIYDMLVSSNYTRKQIADKIGERLGIATYQGKYKPIVTFQQVFNIAVLENKETKKVYCQPVAGGFKEHVKSMLEGVNLYDMYKKTA